MYAYVFLFAGRCSTSLKSFRNSRMFNRHNGPVCLGCWDADQMIDLPQRNRLRPSETPNNIKCEVFCHRKKIKNFNMYGPARIQSHQNQAIWIEKTRLFSRESERRVLLIVGVCQTFSHLHIFISHLQNFTSSHPNILTSSHLLIFTSSSFHLNIFSSSHLLIFTSSSHPHIFAFSSSHLHIFTSSHLHILTSSHLLIFTSSHLHIFTSSHLHIVTFSLALLLTCPLALSFFSI